MGDCHRHQILDEKDNSLATGQWDQVQPHCEELCSYVPCTLASPGGPQPMYQLLTHRVFYYMGRLKMVVEVVECFAVEGV